MEVAENRKVMESEEDIDDDGEEEDQSFERAMGLMHEKQEADGGSKNASHTERQSRLPSFSDSQGHVKVRGVRTRSRSSQRMEVLQSSERIPCAKMDLVEKEDDDFADTPRSGFHRDFIMSGKGKKVREKK